MEFLEKNGLAIYLLLTISMVYSLSPVSAYENALNYILIALGFIFALKEGNIVFSKDSFNYFSIIWLYLLLNVVYQLTLGWSVYKTDDVLYLLGKSSFVFIVVLSLLKYKKFYLKSFYYYYCILISLLFIVGYLLDQNSSGGRLYMGFGNPNTAGAVAAIAFGATLLHPKFNGLLKWLCMLVLSGAVIFTGSRSAIIIMLLSFLFYLKFNFKSIVIISLFSTVAFFTLPKYASELPGVERVLSSFDNKEGKLITNREGEFELGVLMFKNKFWTGYGLTGYKIIDKSIAPFYLKDVLGTHNGYLAAAKMYGIIFLFFFLIIIVLKPLFLFLKYLNYTGNYVNVHLFVAISVLIGTNAEDYIVGLNSTVTTLFFLSLGVLEMQYKTTQEDLEDNIEDDNSEIINKFSDIKNENII